VRICESVYVYPTCIDLLFHHLVSAFQPHQSPVITRSHLGAVMDNRTFTYRLLSVHSHIPPRSKA